MERIVNFQGAPEQRISAGYRLMRVNTGAAVTPGRLRQAKPMATMARTTKAPMRANMTRTDLAMNFTNRMSGMIAAR